MSAHTDRLPPSTLGFAEAMEALDRASVRRRALPAPFADAARASRLGSNPRVGDLTQGPLIATGHQANLWHPGILVKFLLAEGLAGALDGGVLRVLADQDVGHLGPVEFPCRSPEGELAVARLPLEEPDAAAPIAQRRPIRLAAEPDAPPALPAIGEGLAAIATALRRFESSPTAAEQVARSLAWLASRWLPDRPFLPASRLLATPLGLALLDAIAADPQACAERFNESIRRVPGAARPLRVEEERIEAPLWSFDGIGAPRRRVFLPRGDAARRQAMLREAAGADPPRLAPRGLLMTGLVRTAADLFIHGRGGWHYDRATERWFRSWLGIELAPMAMATADLRLPLEDGGEGPAAPSARCRWHDPFASGSPGPSEWKRSRLAALAALPRRSAARRAAFLAMQRELAEARREHALAPPPRRPDAGAIAARRDWAFPLHPVAAIDGLAESASRRVAAWRRDAASQDFSGSGR